jgi:putative ABC transport system permease protein
MEAMQDGRIGFALQPLTRIYLHSHLLWELEPNGYAAYLYLFSVAALLILGIACVNVTNLGTARAMERAREVGIRKTLGAWQKQLIRQYLSESILLSALAVGAALLLVRGLLPVFNAQVGTELSLLDVGLLPLALGAVALALLVGGAAGGYPAFYLSGLQPARVLKGHGAGPAGGERLRRGLVVAQFTASIILLAGALVIHDQIQYLRNADLGFDAEQVVIVPLDETVRSRSRALIASLEQQAGVVRAAAVSNLPGGRFNQNPVRWLDQTVNMAEWHIAPNAVETLGLTLAAGRGFRRDASADVDRAFLVNEAAVRAFGWEDATNREVVWENDDEEIRGTVIGVLEDFHFASLRQSVTPLIAQVRSSEFNYLVVRMEPDAIASALVALENVWEEFAGDRTFDYVFLDHQVDAQYQAEARTQTVVGIFAIVAIGVSALGLFGLTALTVVRRRKEVGIRKALGATTAGLTVHLGADFIRLVGWAFLVATPVTYVAARSWLAHFAYRTDLGPTVFLLAGLGVALVAVLTVAIHVVRAALTDPARVLQTE